jgi:hypothetical protein
MKRLDAKFKTPKHELVTVSLETGTKENGVNGYRRGKIVKVP